MKTPIEIRKGRTKRPVDQPRQSYLFLLLTSIPIDPTLGFYSTSLKPRSSRNRTVKSLGSDRLTRFAQKNGCKKRLAIFLCQVASARRIKSLPHLENTYTLQYSWGFTNQWEAPHLHMCVPNKPQLCCCQSLPRQLEWTCKRRLVLFFL